MAFFKKLKERLLTLEPLEKKSEFKKEDNSQIALVKAQKKLNKKVFSEQKKQAKVSKYVAGLSRSGLSLSRAIREIQTRHHKIDETLFEELEEVLILADISAPLAMTLLDQVRKEVKLNRIEDSKEISEILADQLLRLYTQKETLDTSLDIQDNRVNVILLVGVNGVGKTTTIAKLASKFIQEGKSVLVAAADTFRAGAVAQLAVWADRIGASIVMSEKEGADPASIVFDAVKKAKAENFDILIVDTAGRLQNKVNLMNELEKMSKIISKEIPGAPHESLLVIDATTGQNGVSQAIAFKEVTPISGIVLTKMDGTSRGGIVLTIRDRLGIAVKLIGLGEKLDDLQEFDLDAFIYGLTKDLEV